MTGTRGWATGQACLACGAVYDLSPLFEGCPACAGVGRGSAVAVTYDWERIAASVRRDRLAARPRGLGRFAEFLPRIPPDLAALDAALGEAAGRHRHA